MCLGTRAKGASIGHFGPRIWSHFGLALMLVKRMNITSSNLGIIRPSKIVKMLNIIEL